MADLDHVAPQVWHDEPVHELNALENLIVACVLLQQLRERLKKVLMLPLELWGGT
jgi:hypothetical protein